MLLQGRKLLLPLSVLYRASQTKSEELNAIKTSACFSENYMRHLNWSFCI
jgi:hypothetical protein